MTVRDVDRGAKKLVLNCKSLKGQHLKLKLGIPENAEPYPDGKSVAMVAAVHEFGTDTVPQRAWLRGWFDETGQSAMLGEFRRQGQRVLHGLGSERDLLERAGYWFLRSLKERILRHIPPPLQQSTIERKQRKGAASPETPLLETGHFMESLRAWIVK